MTDLTPFGVLLIALDGDKDKAEKCLSALMDYALDLDWANNEEPVIRFLNGIDWDILSVHDDDWRMM